MNGPEKRTDIIVTFDVVLVYATCKKTDADAVAILFEELSRIGINIDLISLIPPRHAAGILSFTVFNYDFAKILRAVAKLKNSCDTMRMEVCGGYAKIALRGHYFAQETGIISAFFSALRRADSETMIISSSDTTIAALVPVEALDEVVAALETAFPDAETEYHF
ncbi:MAG: ACT domain-containing protein [Ruminococcaceae bacterium]|nr:ACT domain-containing protein [Oscillospiraceae bacterium]